MNAIRHRPAAHRGLLGLALLSSCGVHAADPPKLQPVFVTAARLPQPVASVLSDIRVIDEEQVRAAGALSFTELLQTHAGVEIGANGGPGQPSSVFLRGSNFNHVVLLVDGVRVNSATTGANAFENLPLEQIERIEIVRGPASSLYGADAIGGVIQVFTRQDVRTEARIAAGRWDTRAGSVGLGRRSEDTRLSLQAGYRETAGFSATSPNSQFGFEPDADAYRNRNFGLTLGHDWAPGQSLTARALYSHGDAQFDCGSGSADRSGQRLSSVALESRNRIGPRWTSGLRIARGADHTTLHGPFCASRFDTDHDQVSWQNDLNLAGGLLALGAEWRRERVESDTAFVQDARSIRSLFGSYAVERAPQLLQLSLRHDDNSQFGARTSGNLAYGLRLTPAWRVSAGFGTAFKAPSFNDLYIPLTDFSSPGFPFLYSGNPELRPERSRNAELALRYQAGAARAGLTVFRNRIQDLIANGSVGSAPVINTVVNVARARIRGATLDGAAEAGAWLLRGEATYQEAIDADSGLRLPRRARHHGTLGLAYVPGRWRAGIDLVFSGERFDSLQNAPASRLGGYGLVHLHGGYAFTPEWSVSARLNNATDKHYELVQGYNTPRRNLFVALDYAAK